MENRKVLVLEFAHMLLQLRLIAVPQWIMEIIIRYEGNVKVHPSVFLALSTMRVEILKQRSPSIFMSCVAAVILSSCFIRSSIASTISQVSLKGLPLPNHK